MVFWQVQWSRLLLLLYWMFGNKLKLYYVDVWKANSEFNFPKIIHFFWKIIQDYGSKVHCLLDQLLISTIFQNLWV